MLVMLGASACAPEIGPGTYYCGPERLCPPGLRCDEQSFTCETPEVARAFSCPAGSASDEPDDQLGQAGERGVLACGEALLDGWQGCIDSSADIDHFRFELESECSGPSPHVELSIRFPIALIALELALLDESGEIVASGERCSADGELTGQIGLCISRPLDLGTYVLRVAPGADGADCGGACGYTLYSLDIGHLLSGS